MANVKSYSDILIDLTNRGTQLKAAATKKADSNPAVPEKDPNDKGTVSIPRDPNAAATVQNMPESKTNVDATPTCPTPPASVITQPEKAANLSAKAAAMLTRVRNLQKSAGGTASQISTNGSLPNDAGNDNKSKQPLDTPKPAPVHGTADPAVKESGKEMPADKTQGTAPMPAGDSKGAIPASGENTNTTKKEAAADADPDLANIDHTFFSKLAHVCLQFEEGRAVMEACLKKAHGAEHAQNLIKTAMFMEKRMQELDELEQAGVSAAEEFWKSASDEDRAGLIKLASAHEQALLSFSTPHEREAYMDGVKIAADMADAGMAGAQPPPGVPGMGGEGDPAAAGAAGGQPGGEISDEDVIQALQMLVQENKITEQDAEAILQQLLGGGEGGAGGAPGGAADPGAGAGGPPGGGMPPEAMGGGAGGPPPDAGGPPPDAGGEAKKPEEKEAAAHLKTIGQLVDSVYASLTPKA